MNDLTPADRQACIDRFLDTYTENYISVRIRSAPTDREAIEFCATEHRHGGFTVNLPSGGSAYVHGNYDARSRRGLLIYAEIPDKVPAMIVPWTEVIAPLRQATEQLALL